MLRKIPIFYYIDGGNGEKNHGEFRSDHVKISPLSPFYAIGDWFPIPHMNFDFKKSNQ